VTETLRVLVAGVTGQQGSAVARALLERGHAVVGLARRPEKARAWRSRGVEIVRGDLTDRASIEKALKGMDAFFLVTSWFEKGTEDEARQGLTALDAARVASVDHTVFSSVASADEALGLRHFESKARIERHARRSGIPLTIVRPVAFMENFLSPWMAPSIQSGTLAQPIKPTTRVQHIAIRDHADFVAERLVRRDGLGETIEIAGDAATFPEIAAMLGERFGRPIRFVELSDEQATPFIGEEGVAMNRWFDRFGYHVDIKSLERRWGIRMTSFQEFFRGATLPPG